jgi:hypothetical protein
MRREGVLIVAVVLLMPAVACADIIPEWVIAELADVPMSFLGIHGQTAVYQGHLDALEGSVESVFITDENSCGGSDGSLTGFDLDFLLFDADGEFATGDEFGLVSAAFLTAGDVRSPATSFYQPTSLHPGPLFGTDANSDVRLDVASLATHDACYVAGEGLFVDTCSGWVSLGDGGSVQIIVDSIEPPQPTMYVYVGDAGMNDESMDAIVQVAVGIIPEPATLSLLVGGAGLVLLRRRR